MTQGSRTTRKRGVRASRTRLYRALADAGLKTQVALAERIADLEGLDAAPKDVVNRVFRELPVELHTLERIARALEVDAWTLYLRADDPPSPLTVDDQDASASAELPPSPRRDRAQSPRFLGAVALLAGIALAFGGWWFSSLGPQGGPGMDTPDAAIFPALGLGRPTIVVLPFAGDDDGAFSAALRLKLAATFNVASSAAALLTAPGVANAADLLRTDLGVDGEIVTVARLSGVRLFVHAGGLRRQVWAESLPAAQLPASIDTLASNAAVAINHAAGLASPDSGAPGHFPLAPVQDDYLEGYLHLDRPATELTIKRAQSRFSAALRQDANYARAHAGLCESLLEEHWMEDEARALQDAALACGRALQLRPDDAVVQVVHAHFLRRTGRLAESIELLESILVRLPDDAFALEGLAATQFHLFRQEGDRAALEAAIQAAERAAAADPLAWEVLSRLAQMKLLAGHLDDAILAIEQALARDENEHVLANAGTLHFCAGDVERARDLYVRARQTAPESYVGEEFLGMLHYFLGEYEISTDLRRRAIERVAASGEPEIHQMWGNLGDSYRQSEQLDLAIEAYRRAAEIVERDFLRGTATVTDRVYRAYYYTMIRAFHADPSRAEAGPAGSEGTRLAVVLDQDIVDELLSVEAEAADPAAHLRLAQAWLQHGDLVRARAAMAQAMDFCVGYARMPDLAALRSGNPGD